MSKKQIELSHFNFSSISQMVVFERMIINLSVHLPSQSEVVLLFNHCILYLKQIFVKLPKFLRTFDNFRMQSVIRINDSYQKIQDPIKGSVFKKRSFVRHIITISIDFFKQQVLFISTVYSPFYNNRLQMFQNQNFPNCYANTQASLYPTHPNIPQNYPVNITQFIWEIPLYYSLRTFSVVYSPQNLPLTAHTINQVPPPTPISQRQERKINYANRRNRRQKKRIRNSIKELQSAKKNSQSNIVNQFYSFFSRYQQSQKIVEKIILRFHKSQADIQKIKNLFYNVVMMINLKRGRKYVNRDNILNYYTPERLKNQFQNIEDRLLEIGLINLEQFCYLFRVLAAEFIKNISVTAILTSRRISFIARNQHLKRRRKIFGLFFKGSQ